jgi:hypothetical protein
VILFTYEKNGKASSFTAENFPADFDDSYKFVKREDKLIRKGTAVAAIRDFTLQTANGNDTTLSLLNEDGDKLFLFVKDGYLEGEWVPVMQMILQRAAARGIKSFLVTNLELEPRPVPSLSQLIPLRSDGTAIKTAARYNPTLFLISKGTIKQKWGAMDFDKALKMIGKSPTNK